MSVETAATATRSHVQARAPSTLHRAVLAEAIDDVVRQIVERFRPRRIILFGSYAYGEPHPGSDVDMLVVMDVPGKEAEQAVRICQAIDYHFGLDLIVRSPQTLAQRLALGDPFLQEVVSRGKVLYDATGR